MPLMDWAIGLACTTAYQNHTDACGKFLEASAKQTQVYQTEQKTENYFSLVAKNHADNYLGEDASAVGGGVYYVVKSYRNKAVDLKLPTAGVCDKITVHAGQDSYNLGFSWRIW